MNFFGWFVRNAADVHSSVGHRHFLDRQNVADDRAVAVFEVDDVQVCLVDVGGDPVIADFEDRRIIV